MAVAFSKRLLNAAGDLDRAVADLWGAKWFQTISGSVGRACGFGGGTKKWWGPPCRFIIDGIPCFGQGHCQRWAEREQEEERVLSAAGLDE